MSEIARSLPSSPQNLESPKYNAGLVGNSKLIPKSNSQSGPANADHGVHHPSSQTLAPQDAVVVTKSILSGHITCERCGTLVPGPNFMEGHQKTKWCQTYQKNGNVGGFYSVEPSPAQIRDLALQSRPYKCPNCDFTCAQRRDLTKHVTVNDITGLSFCSAAQEAARLLPASESAMNYRKFIAQQVIEIWPLGSRKPGIDGFFSCPAEQCSFLSSSTETVLAHIREMHLHYVRPSRILERCQWCNAPSSTRATLAHHQETCKRRPRTVSGSG